MFEKLYTKLVDALIDPIIQYILKTHWALRVFIVLLLACVSLNLTNPGFFTEALCYVESTIKHSFTTNTSTVYLSDNTKERLESTVSRLKLALQRDIKTQENKTQENAPWAIAQMNLALTNKNTVDAQAVQSINKVVNTECSCWKEGENQPNHKYPRHIPATAWALFTLAYNAHRPTDAQVSFVLDSQQKEEGWWPIFPTRDKQYSSTYATAWAILALDKLSKTSLLSQELDAKARNAIANGRAWLFQQREPGSARWKNYPLWKTGEVSLSLSGLVIHALHQTASADKSELRELSESWIAQLPDKIPVASECETPYAWINSQDGAEQDSICQLVVPWLIIGTVDVYNMSNLKNKVRLSCWLEQALLHSDISNSDTVDEDWKRAEVTLALRYLLGEF
jgi:hypothetical protein